MKTRLIGFCVSICLCWGAYASAPEDDSDYVRSIIEQSYVKKVSVFPINALSLQRIFSVSIYQADLEVDKPNGASNLLGTNIGFVYNGQFIVPNIRYQKDMVPLQQIIRPDFSIQTKIDVMMLKHALDILFPASQLANASDQRRIMVQTSPTVWVYVRGMHLGNLSGLIIYTDAEGRIVRILNAMNLKAMFG